MHHRKSWVDLCQQQAPVKETRWWSHDYIQNSYTESDSGLVSTQLNCLVNFRFVYLMSWVSKTLGLYILLSVRAAVFQSYYCVLQFSTGKNTSLPFCHCPSVSNPVPLFLTLCLLSLSMSIRPCPPFPVSVSIVLALSMSLCPSVPLSIFYCV